jgi:hypothetical protein
MTVLLGSSRSTSILFVKRNHHQSHSQNFSTLAMIVSEKELMLKIWMDDEILIIIEQVAHEVLLTDRKMCFFLGKIKHFLLQGTRH